MQERWDEKFRSRWEAESMEADYTRSCRAGATPQRRERGGHARFCSRMLQDPSRGWAPRSAAMAGIWLLLRDPPPALALPSICSEATEMCATCTQIISVSHSLIRADGDIAGSADLAARNSKQQSTMAGGGCAALCSGKRLSLAAWAILSTSLSIHPRPTVYTHARYRLLVYIK